MIEYTAVNVATFLVGLGLLLNGYLVVKRGREDVALLVVSAVVGAGLIVVALFPDVFEVVAALLGLELKARAILVVSNLTLFLVAIYLFNRVGRLYERVSKLNEELSLLKAAVDEGTADGDGPEPPAARNAQTAVSDGGEDGRGPVDGGRE